MRRSDVRAFLAAGHWPTLVTSLLYFDLCFAVWVLNGAMAPFIARDLGLGDVEKGWMLSVPVMAGAFMRLPLGILSQYIGRKNAALVEMGTIVVAFAALGAGNGAVFQLVPLRFRGSTAVAGSLIGEVGALGGGFLPVAMGYARASTGSFALGFVALALAAAAVWAVLRAASRRWTRTWADEGGRALAPVPMAPLMEVNG